MYREAPAAGSQERISMAFHAKGDRVTQPQYGPGTVTDVNAQHTVIDFDQHGVRTFVTNLVKLEPTTEARPAPRATAARKRTKKASTATEPVAPPRSE
jgi:hypothetical protein